MTLSGFYDHLSRFTFLTNFLKYGNRYGGFTMHKPLLPVQNPIPAVRRNSRFTYLEDLALSLVRLPANPVVLDAGCGFGGTVFHWHEKAGGCYDGLTVSPVQLSVARAEARRRGIDPDCKFHLRSYDEPLQRKYHAMIAIESLIHSSNFEETVRNLASGLKTGGYFLVVDDMIVDEAASKQNRKVATLERCWHLTRIPSEEDYRKAFESSGIQVIHEVDLTGRIEFMNRSLIILTRMILALLRAAVVVSPVRVILSAHLGGLALQNLYLAKAVRYRLVLGRKGFGVAGSD